MDGHELWPPLDPPLSMWSICYLAAHAILGGWTTRRGQLSMVEGDEGRGKGEVVCQLLIIVLITVVCSVSLILMSVG